MVARLLRLRVALALAPLRRGIRDSVFALVLRLLFIVLFAACAVLPVLLIADDPALLARYDIIFGSLVLLSACVVPLFAPKSILDARAFQQTPITPPKLAISLLVSSPATWPGVAVLVWLTTFVVLRRELLDWNLVSILSVVVLAVSVPVLARFSGALGVYLCRSPRLMHLQKGLGILLLIAALPVLALITVSLIRADNVGQLDDAADFLSWTPFGALFAAMHSSVAEPSASILQLGLHFALIAVLTGAIISLTTALLGKIDRPSEGAVMSNSLGWFDYLPMTPAMSIGARSLTYWMRDPRYLVSLIAIPLIPVLVLGVLMFAGISPAHLAIIPLPLVLMMIGWMIHNDVATDSTAMWIHVASGTTGRQDRVGRTVPVFVFGIPVLIIGSSVTVVVMGNWQAFPAVVAVGIVALSASTAISSVTSTVRPYPTTRPGESPFVQPAWQGAGAGLSQTIAFLGSVVLVGPVLWLLLAGPEIDLSSSFLILAGSLVYSAVLLIIGLMLGGAIFNRRSSELLAFMQVFD